MLAAKSRFLQGINLLNETYSKLHLMQMGKMPMSLPSRAVCWMKRALMTRSSWLRALLHTLQISSVLISSSTSCWVA